MLNVGGRNSYFYSSVPGTSHLVLVTSVHAAFIYYFFSKTIFFKPNRTAQTVIWYKCSGSQTFEIYIYIYITTTLFA